MGTILFTGKYINVTGYYYKIYNYKSRAGTWKYTDNLH